MRLQDRIVGWSGWRRHAPAAASLLGHGVFCLAAASLGGAARLGLASLERPPAPVLDVTLVAETALRAPAAEPRQSQSSRASTSQTGASNASAAAPGAKRASAPSRAQNDADEGVFLGEGVISEIPLGLRSMLEDDPCKPKKGLPRGDCDHNWSETFASGQIKAIPDILPPPPHAGPGAVLGFGMGGPPVQRRPGVLRPVGALPGGAASLGGINDLVGRLPPSVPDPGFGD